MPHRQQAQLINTYHAAEAMLRDDGFYIYNPEDAEPSEKQLQARPSPFDKNRAPQHAAADLIKSKLATKKEAVKQEPIAIEKTETYDIAAIVENLTAHTRWISTNVIGREEIIQQALYAVLTREHMLFLSRTGMAKSFLANYFFSIFDNVRIFASQASKDQTPDNYFGPYNIEEFKKGKIRHNIHGSIIEADLVFLDEFFDASDVVLRSLLSVLNERKFINGQEIIDAAVHSAIATANYMRMNEVTEAILDRFMFKAIIPEDYNMYSQLLIDDSYALNKGAPLRHERKVLFNQIIYLSDIIRNNNTEIKIAIPELVFFLKNVLIHRYVSEMRKSDPDFFISPRKQAKIADFLRASAVLDNRFEANLDDLKNMSIALCTMNSYIGGNIKNKTEQETFYDIYQQMLVHFNTSGALQQAEYILNVRAIFRDIRKNPELKDKLHEMTGPWQRLRNLLKKLFPNKSDEQEPKITVEALRTTISDMKPAIEEIRDLKDGILKDYKDIF